MLDLTVNLIHCFTSIKETYKYKFNWRSSGRCEKAHYKGPRETKNMEKRGNNYSLNEKQSNTVLKEQNVTWVC